MKLRMDSSDPVTVGSIKSILSKFLSEKISLRMMTIVVENTALNIQVTDLKSQADSRLKHLDAQTAYPGLYDISINERCTCTI